MYRVLAVMKSDSQKTGAEAERILNQSESQGWTLVSTSASGAVLYLLLKK
jgi:hypothetical protein